MLIEHPRLAIADMDGLEDPIPAGEAEIVGPDERGISRKKAPAQHS
jgi:hypothetical protein